MTTHTITFGSVCSGIEAASVAWHPLGWRAAWLAEIEPFPSAVLAHHYPDVPNLGDMTKLPERIRSGEVAAPDVFCGGTPCFTAGHMVLTASGYRAIEDLAPGEEVMTHKGRMRKILRVGSKVAPVGRLSAVGLPDGIVCTEEHPFLSSYWRNQNTKRNNVYAKVETCSEPEWVAAKDMPGRQWCALSQVDPTACKPDSRLFDERTAMYVAGMYLGDGWLRCWDGKKKRAVMLGLNEAKYQKLLAVIGQASHSISRERTGIKVSFGDTAFANWLDANFGRHSHLKTLPAWVMGHPHRDALLQGYMDTDGCVDGNKVTINSTSKSLAHGVCDLLNIQGWSASIAKVETEETCVIEGRTVNQRDYFQVRANHLSVSRKSRVRHGYLMRTVQAWEPAGEEMVFNIEVEEDNSFILAGAVVHNCQAFSVAGLRKSLDDARGNLSLTFCDIANEIDSARSVRGLLPSIVFWENVPGVLNTADNAFGCFLAGLAGEDEPLVAPGGKWSNAGYVLGPKRAVAWRVLDAQYFGVPQRRRRVFVVASARNGFDPAAVLFEFDGLRRDTPPRREAGQGAARGIEIGPSGGRFTDLNPTLDTRAKDGPIRNQLAGAVLQPYDVGNTLTARMAKGINSTLDEGQTPAAVGAFKGGQGSAAGGIGWDEHVSPTLSSADSGSNRTPALLTSMQVRRLTPVECERLQGFPTVSEKITIEACLDPQNQSVHVALKCLRWQNSVSNADENELTQPAKTVDALSSTSPAHLAPLAALHVRMHSVDELLEILSAGRLIWSASGAGQSKKSLPPTLTENSVRELARMLREVGRTVRNGKAASPPSISLSFPALSGGTSAGKSGQETVANASGAMSVQSKDTFTTSDLGLITTCSDSIAETLCCSALHAIAGCIPSTTLPVTFSIELTVETPYTLIPWRKKPAADCPDGPRYKALGNSWAVPVVTWIGRRIAEAL